MKNVVKKLWVLVVTLIVGLSSFAFEVDGICYEIINGGSTVRVISKSGGYSGDIVIPSTVTYNNEVYTVTIISGFSLCKTLTSIELPNTITTIGEWGFNGCEKLASINIPSGITAIPHDCFHGCSSLISIELPSTVATIGKQAFRNCLKLTSINIPNGVTEIPECCFECTSLTTLELPNTITTIGEKAFYRCEKLQSINIPDGIKEIPESCFYNCSLTSIEIPNTVTSIGEEAFNGCSKLTSINIPDGIKEIPNYCFYNCISLQSIEIPNTVTNFGNGAFNRCSKLTSINIPNGIKEIPNDCFGSCSSLTSIEIPSTVTSFGSGAFNGCSKLTSINIPSGITEIPSTCFSYCSLTSIEIPGTVTNIGSGAFYGCSKLTSINIPSEITEIPGSCFGSCSSLISIEIPSTVTSIGEQAFWHCEKLTSIEIPNTVTSIGVQAFDGCSKLTSINIPSGITEIPGACFSGCSSLISIKIPNTVATIGDNAFGFTYWVCKNINTIYCKAQVPPEMSTETASGIPNNATLYVPCGYKAAYMAAEGWQDFSNIIETNYVVKLLSSNDSQGSVSYEGSLCADDGKVNLVATPSGSSQFVQWSDGNTDNPRTVVIDKDTSFTAIFGDKPIISVTSTKRPVCDAYNGSITISVSSGVEPYVYQWSDGSTEANRSGLQSGTYTIKVTDAIGRYDEKVIDLQSDQSMKAQIYPETVDPICETENGSISLSVSGGTAPYTYKWADSETTDLSRNGLASGQYVFTVTDAAGCISEKKIDLVKNEDNMPIISAETKNAICGQNIGEISIEISGGTAPYTYAWGDNNTQSLTRTNLLPKTYKFSVSDSYGCKTDWEKEIIAESFKYQPEIALVSVSQEVKAANLVVWQKEQTEAIYYYTIYRETEKTDEYKPIAMVAYTDQSLYVDEKTNNMQQPYKYKITATDFCGTESPLSDYHKTIHLTKGVSLGSAINLIWDGYEGFDFETYSVYRVTLTGVSEIAQVTSTTWTYTDMNPPVGTISYYVGVKLPKEIDVNEPFQKAESGPFSLAISNIAELENDNTGVDDVVGAFANVYGANQQIVVESSEECQITVCTAMGQTIAQVMAQNTEGKTVIPVKTAGVYIVIVGNDVFKVVVE